MTILTPPLAKFSPAARTKAPPPPAGRRCAAKIGYPNRHHHTCMVWTRRRCPGPLQQHRVQLLQGSDSFCYQRKGIRTGIKRPGRMLRADTVLRMLASGPDHVRISGVQVLFQKGPGSGPDVSIRTRSSLSSSGPGPERGSGSCSLYGPGT